MASLNALSVALFNAAAGGYATEMAANPAAFVNAVGPILEKDLSTDALFIAHLLDNLGVATTNAAYAEAKTAEMAALTVSPQSQGQGDGEKVLKRIEQRARAMGLQSIFVLTTRTMHWFMKRGFVQMDADWLPEGRKRKYNWDRRSQVLVKKLS